MSRGLSEKIDQFSLDGTLKGPLLARGPPKSLTQCLFWGFMKVWEVHMRPVMVPL